MPLPYVFTLQTFHRLLRFFYLDLAQGQMNMAPNDIRTHWLSLSCLVNLFITGSATLSLRLVIYNAFYFDVVQGR